MGEIIGANGLRYYELSNVYGHGVPQWPSAANLNVRVHKFHANDGIFVQQIESIMHRSTHMDAQLHVTENGKSLTGYDTWRFFGTGVVVSIPKGKWEVITPDDLEKANPKIQRGDILIINTGSHHKLGDNDDYFAYSPGLYKEAAEWIVERGVKMLGIDVQALDHPLGTKLADHGLGPSHPHLDGEYKALTGRHILEDFPHWEPAHKIMMGAGIPGIENIGGDVDLVTGKRCTIMAFPWRWHTGEGCVVRVVAVLDPEQKFRIPTGA
ncbi:MAG: cyclase family protein [Rhodoplanes sp.]|uniref:cyclase family protein n=1 Tax=Rhodoplanes sp. TaxID=1968906 RepID=UPI00183DDF50|nr:cyclase family protein [Rhodoplanes sp.]NVO13081.1 cyclase family protein [Rhodoplanes sp.]